VTRGWVLAASLAIFAGCAPRPPTFAARLPDRPQREPSDIDHTEGTFPSADKKVVLFEQSWRPRAKARGVIVIVHGLKDHSSRYDAFAIDAVRRGYAVDAFDLRGHGRSGGERVWIDAFDEYLDDLDVFLGRVEAKEPGVPRFLLGHSMGGAIVTLDVITRRPKVAGIVLSAAALEVDVSGPTVLGTKIVGTIAPHTGVFQLDVNDFSRDPRTVWEARVDPLVYQDPAPAHTAKELLAAIDRIGEGMAQVNVPMLVMHGGADKVTPPLGSRDLAARAWSTDKSLRIYDGLYHDLLHEPERAQVTLAVLGWLDTHTRQE
jgi:alpha-beta hydrolase superfamily lysophospholipase